MTTKELESKIESLEKRIEELEKAPKTVIEKHYYHQQSQPNVTYFPVVYYSC